MYNYKEDCKYKKVADKIDRLYQDIKSVRAAVTQISDNSDRSSMLHRLWLKLEGEEKTTFNYLLDEEMKNRKEANYAFNSEHLKMNMIISDSLNKLLCFCKYCKNKECDKCPAFKFLEIKESVV